VFLDPGPSSNPVSCCRIHHRCIILSSTPASQFLRLLPPTISITTYNKSSKENMGWQKTFTLSRRGKGCHLVTDEVVGQIRDGMKDVKVGMLYLFIQHTSAALTINENCDPDVRKDMDMALDKIVPESLNWLHTDEGPDDSVSHTKASILGSTISMPITDGRLNLGTWQGA
jgi:secondary thiamine-phosphate synthase enzyme